MGPTPRQVSLPAKTPAQPRAASKDPPARLFYHAPSTSISTGTSTGSHAAPGVSEPPHSEEYGVRPQSEAPETVAEQAAAERAAAERAAAEGAAAERAAAERAAAERVAVVRAAARRVALHRAKAERAAAKKEAVREVKAQIVALERAAAKKEAVRDMALRQTKAARAAAKKEAVREVKALIVMAERAAAEREGPDQGDMTRAAARQEAVGVAEAVSQAAEPAQQREQAEAWRRPASAALSRLSLHGERVDKPCAPTSWHETPQRRHFDEMLRGVQQAHLRATVETEPRTSSFSSAGTAWCRDNRR